MECCAIEKTYGTAGSWDRVAGGGFCPLRTAVIAKLYIVCRRKIKQNINCWWNDSYRGRT